MERRLVALAAAVPVAVLLSAPVPALAIVAAVLIPAASIAWAVRGSSGAWALAVLPGALAVGWVSPEGLGAYGASALAGPVVARARRSGVAPGRALVWGVLPLAAWTAGLALSGFQPFPEDGEALLASLRMESLPPEQLADVQSSAGAALEVLRRTWVALELVWFWVCLACAWWVAGRLALPGQPGLGEFSRLDLPDVWVGGLIAGLALVLTGSSAPPLDAAATVGWNLVVGSGFAFGLRGVAIESFWLKRAGWKRPARGAALAAGLVAAAPLFLALALGLGLFDTWFDFRRIRGPATPAEANS